MTLQPPASFYREPDQQLCQGDLVRAVPHLHLKPPLQMLRPQSTSQGQLLAPYDISPGAAPPVRQGRSSSPVRLRLSEGEHVSAFCQIALGIVLSHGCEIEKDNRHRLLALVRPLGPLPPDVQQVIRDK